MNRIEIHASVKLAWQIANREAWLSGCESIEPIHFLLAALLIVDHCFERDAEDLGLSASIIEEINAISANLREILALPEERITAIRRELTRTLRRADAKSESLLLHRSQLSRELFEQAAVLKLGKDDSAINLLHLLLALLQQIPGKTAKENPDRLPSLIRKLRAQMPRQVQCSQEAVSSGSKTAILDELGRDLTTLAKNGRLAPLVGRKTEMIALARHLRRTTKPNVLIVGDPGVGKSALVEGLAQRIAMGEVPDFFQNLRIVQLDVSDLVAGTHYRGDMEERIKRIVEEAASDPNIVLFLDEFHLAVGAGTAGASPMDIASILRPALSRDKFRCIGATTIDEYERFMKSDAALLRRFQILKISEPTKEEAIQVCTEWARRIERFQEVVFAEDAIPAAVELSIEFIRERSLPDKAIDLLENAAVLVKISSLSVRSASPQKVPPIVSRKHIISAIEEQYHISVRRTEQLNGEEIRSGLIEEIVGQSEAIVTLSTELESLRERNESDRGPLSVLMFTGPTGTGKTYAAECLGHILFPESKNATIRFNMNEYKERYEISKLIGAPPGLIGHEQPGSLFRYAEAHPKGIIILDEFEKANSEILDYFLQIFDKGEAQDSRGRKVDFGQYLFIATCNVTAGSFRKPIGFGTSGGVVTDGPQLEVYPELSQYFRRELLARFRRVISFKPLDRIDYGILLDRRLAQLLRAMEKSCPVAVTISENAVNHFLDLCVEQPNGCRGFDRLFDRLISFTVRKAIAENPTVRRFAFVDFSGSSPIYECGS